MEGKERKQQVVNHPYLTTFSYDQSGIGSKISLPRTS